ncbi:MAG: polyphosphate kinase 1 [Gemmatimonadaceae bacterium]|nr:polyphosphate kinase 1 [Gemmatimonadaceae bacterium]
MTSSPPDTELFDPELSLLAFQRRVLALAQDPQVPLLERMRFLGIVTSNIDELYMIRMVELRRAALDAPPDDDGPRQRLHAVEHELADILAAQAQCAEQCVREAEAFGARLVSWDALTHNERTALRERYLAEIQPDLMAHTITLSPGHPLPHLPHLGLFIAVTFHTPTQERVRLAEHELPRDVPRLLPVPGREGTAIAIEDVLRANIHALYPQAIIDGAYLFRVTRGGDLPLAEYDMGDLLGAVELATELRPHNPAVRVEVERTMPASVGALLLESLRREAIGRDMELTVDAVQVVDGLLDLRCLASFPFPDTPRAVVSYPPMIAHNPLRTDVSMADQMDAGDLFLHHPFEDFEQSVVRFFREAADDPSVVSISTTLYRVGNPSPIIEALLAAATAGKSVFALVELQARFDEEHNVHWGRALERAGGKVVYGLPGLKVHAKAALVTRRTDDRVERYAHIGTGNYNTRSGRQYTDFSLFSARDAITQDLADLFAALSRSSDVPEGLAHGALVAPHQLRRALLERIARETSWAERGQPASIAIKVNGLADTEMVRALSRASQAGVDVQLIVRGICTLRPGVVGRSERIRVISVVGRFLEHSRVYRFGNGGATEYLIGSADLRPRNLRRRVELLVPVIEPAHRRRLDGLLTRYLEDDHAWELRADGRYTQRAAVRPSAQQQWIAETAATVS